MSEEEVSDFTIIRGLKLVSITVCAIQTFLTFVLINAESFAVDFDQARYDSMFSLPQGVIRLIASQELSEGKAEGIDTVTAIRMLIDALSAEVTPPSSNIRRVGPYLTDSQATVRRLIFGLAALGPAHADYMRQKAANDTSQVGSAIIIALGLIKDSRVHENLREIVRNEIDPNIRAMAVKALSEYKDTLDVPLFAQALSDTNIVVMELDVATHDGQFHKLVNIVGMAAVPALYELGYKWEADTINGTYKAVKIK